MKHSIFTLLICIFISFSCFSQNIDKESKTRTKYHVLQYDLNGNFHSDETIPFAEGELERPWAFFNKKKNQIVIFQTPYKTYQKY